MNRLAGVFASLVGFFLFIVGCTARSAVELVTETPVQAVKIAPFPANPVATTSSIREPTVIPLAPVGIDIQQAGQTSTPVEFLPTRTPEIQPTFEICSPLSIHPLEELPEIISDPYHPPPPGKEERHQGVDFSYYRRGDRLSIRGVGVRSVLDGTVAMALAETFPYGNVIIVETPQDSLPANLARDLETVQGESLYVLYAHLENPPEVRIGEKVTACQVLGNVGMSGNAGVPHLHIETRIGRADARFQGMRFYDTHASQGEKDNYLLWRTSGIYRHFDPMRLLLFGLSQEQ